MHIKAKAIFDAVPSFLRMGMQVVPRVWPIARIAGLNSGGHFYACSEKKVLDWSSFGDK